MIPHRAGLAHWYENIITRITNEQFRMIVRQSSLEHDIEKDRFHLYYKKYRNIILYHLEKAALIERRKS